MSPDLIPSVWTPDDALAGHCTVSCVGLPRTDALSSLPADDVAAMARQLAPAALVALLRVAQYGGRGSVEAARLLLAYAYGPPATAAPAQAIGGNANLLPAWEPDMRKRLGYQADAADSLLPNGHRSPDSH